MAGEAVAFVTVGPRASRIWIYLVHSGGRQLHAADAEQMMSMRAALSGHITRKGGNTARPFQKNQNRKRLQRPTVPPI